MPGDVVPWPPVTAVCCLRRKVCAVLLWIEAVVCAALLLTEVEVESDMLSQLTWWWTVYRTDEGYWVGS